MLCRLSFYFFFFSSRRRHTILQGDWSSDVCSSDLGLAVGAEGRRAVDADERGQRLIGTPLEREGAVEIGIALLERREGQRARVGAPHRREIDGAVLRDRRRADAVVVG